MTSTVRVCYNGRSYMKIKYLGHSSFKITGKSDEDQNITIVTDPFDAKSVGFNFPTTEADIVTISHNHADHNSTEKIKPKEGNLFIADTPGEYEVADMRIYGLNSFHDNKSGSERGNNTIFIYDFKEARVAHLGDIGHDLTSDLIEELENVEILMIPTGGVYTIDIKLALEIIGEIEPLIVIPMHFKTDKHNASYKDLSSLDDFIAKASLPVQNVEELTIKTKSDLPNTLTIFNIAI